MDYWMVEAAISWASQKSVSRNVPGIVRFTQTLFRHDQIGRAGPFRKSVIDRTEAGIAFGPSTLIAQQAS
jgi:hypothetical protein